MTGKRITGLSVRGAMGERLAGLSRGSRRPWRAIIGRRSYDLVVRDVPSAVKRREDKEYVRVFDRFEPGWSTEVVVTVSENDPPWIEYVSAPDGGTDVRITCGTSRRRCAGEVGLL